jgi:hypothetical protein
MSIKSGEFSLIRNEDISGISGTGRVAQGFVFEDGTAALRWLTKDRSMCFYGSIEELERIHGHNGSTQVVFGPRGEETAGVTEVTSEELIGLAMYLRSHGLTVKEARMPVVLYSGKPISMIQKKYDNWEDVVVWAERACVGTVILYRMEAEHKVLRFALV